MKIAVVSDTHNRHEITARALAEVRKRGIETVIHCGDIEDAETVALFRGFTAHLVFGNCDDDREGLRAAMLAAKATLHEPFGHLELAGTKLAFIHSDDRSLFRSIENSSAYDFLFYGHSHVREDHWTGPTHVVNPGACTGPGRRHSP